MVSNDLWNFNVLEGAGGCKYTQAIHLSALFDVYCSHSRDVIVGPGLVSFSTDEHFKCETY